MGIPTRAPLATRPTISFNVPSAFESYIGELASDSHDSTSTIIPRSDTTVPCDTDSSLQCECLPKLDDMSASDDEPLRSYPLYDHRETEIEMVLQYISDWEDGRYDDWKSTRTQGLRGVARAGNRPQDEDPSRNRPTKVPLSYLLRKIRFASAVNRACEAAGSDDSPFPDGRFIFRSESVISYGVQRIDRGSLHTLRESHEHVYHSRLLPLHPSS